MGYFTVLINTDATHTGFSVTTTSTCVLLQIRVPFYEGAVSESAVLFWVPKLDPKLENLPVNYPYGNPYRSL